MSKPLLIFPKQVNILKRTGLHPTPIPKLFHPTVKDQVSKFDQKISNIEKALENETISISSSIEGLEPERILVFEIKGSIEDFYKAVDKTKGMEFLREFDLGEDEPDDSFQYKKKNKETKIFDKVDNKISRKVFITINNLQAIKEIKRYWDWYKQGLNKKFRSKQVTKFRTLFEQLNDIRYYSVKDRYEDTGILEDLKYRLEQNEEQLSFEIELTYRNDVNYLKKTFDNLKVLIENSGGQVIEKSHIIIKEIKYHAFIAKAPISLFNELKEDTDVPFFKCEQVLFFRPIGQSVITMQNEKVSDHNEDFIEHVKDISLKEESIIALLDGMPLQNHSLLQNKLLIDDPENIESSYPSAARVHGTAMASLILYGDLNSEDSSLLSRKVYIRPILYALYNDYNQIYEESVPNDRLFIDIIHSAVKRIFEGSNNKSPIAPNIKIINFSIGDAHRQFIYNNSSWARLIDWLSFKYNVLFIISAGNYLENIELNENVFEDLSPLDKEKLVLKEIINKNSERKIIAPAEAVNAITVGAFNSDLYTDSFITTNSRVELIETQNQISPISRIGLGYLRGIKPDILMPGGRQLFRKHPINNSFSIDKSNKAPGHKVACLNGVHFTRGTSNATALATRFGARIHQVLEELEFENLSIPNEYFSVIIKALLVHGASKENMDLFIEELGSGKRKLLSYIGHGLIINEEKVLNCTEQQVTLVGYGKLNNEGSHLFELPLPNEISSIQVSKQLTITLAWFTPINFSSNKYRKAALYIDNITGSNSTNTEIDWNKGNEYDYNASKKGSVQHLRCKGTGADAYIENSVLKIKINCREDAPKLDETIRYGLAVTFELIDNATIEIYEEIKQRIVQKIKIS